MTHVELTLLLSGIAIGFDLAVAMHFGYEILDVRRERRRREAEEASVAEKATQARELTGSRQPPTGPAGASSCPANQSLTDTYANPAIVGTEKRL